MNYERFERLNIILSSKKSEIEAIRESNKKVETLSRESADLELSKCKVSTYIRALEKILLATKKEDSSFKATRLNYLKAKIKSEQERIFDDTFDVELKPDLVRNKRVAKLRISINGGKLTNPVNSSGGFGQQLISSSGSLAVLELLNKNKVFIDEAFNASSTENLSHVGEMLKPYPENGVQIILISQSGALYQDLPRREIILERSNDEARLVSVKDWGE